MSIDDPPEAQFQALANPSQSAQTDLSKKEKKKKKKKKKKGKKSIAKNKRNNPKSYGAGPRFSRRESIPHHVTVQSLASINQPTIVNQLTKMSQDLKYHRELQKALMELKQKDEDYRYAIEIGESLTKENQYLKEQIEILESQLHHEGTDNTILKEKLETLSSTYHQDLYKYHQDLQAHKELVNELTNTLQAKQEELNIQKQIKSINNNNNNNKYGNYNNNTKSDLEKQLKLQLENEKKKHLEDQQTIENLMKKLDDMMDLKKKYDALKKSNNELKQITKDELAQHIQMQKSIEAEAIYLAARKANLEEEREDLLNLLDQRDYEITMLNQQLTLQRKQQSITGGIGGIKSLNDDIPDNMMINNGDDDDDDSGESTGGDDDNVYYQQHEIDDDGVDIEDDDDNNNNNNNNKPQQPPLTDEDEIDIIAEILDDEDIFDQELYDDDDDDDDDNDDNNGNDISHQQIKQQQPYNQQRSTSRGPYKREEKKEEAKENKVFDKIKEYLHLSASAVKIKYPTVKNIQSDELIKKVKELPFYKYHDQMVRIMEQEIKKIRDAEKARNRINEINQLHDDPPPVMQKRKSFLSIFNIFSGDKSGGASDDESNAGSEGDNKSDGGISDNDDNDAGISGRRKRRHSHSRKRKRSFKKRKHRKSLSKKGDDDNDKNGNDDNNNNETKGNNTRYRRGLSVQASQQRLKNT